MRLLSILSAVVVITTLILLTFQREELLSFAGVDASGEQNIETAAAADATVQAETDDNRVSVVAVQSLASSVDGAVVLRGRTEAARQVDVRAETSGLIINEPSRKGSFVEEGDLLCELDPGTREIALAEASARLSEAMAGLPTAEARLAEANARLREAEINDNAASRLSEGGFASETRVAATTAAVEAARAQVQSAKSGLYRFSRTSQTRQQRGYPALRVRARFRQNRWRWSQAGSRQRRSSFQPPQAHSDPTLSQTNLGLRDW